MQKLELVWTFANIAEETDWIGGQLTAQAVPPDEHPWIEGTGCTASYQRLRRGVRDYYRRNSPLLPAIEGAEPCVLQTRLGVVLEWPNPRATAR